MQASHTGVDAVTSLPIHYQQGISLLEPLPCVGTEAACIAALRRARLPGGFRARGARELHISCWLVGCGACSVRSVPSLDLANGENVIFDHQAAAEPVVAGDLPAQLSQDWAGGTGSEAQGLR